MQIRKSSSDLSDGVISVSLPSRRRAHRYPGRHGVRSLARRRCPSGTRGATEHALRYPGRHRVRSLARRRRPWVPGAPPSTLLGTRGATEYVRWPADAARWVPGAPPSTLLGTRGATEYVRWPQETRVLDSRGATERCWLAAEPGDAPGSFGKMIFLLKPIRQSVSGCPNAREAVHLGPKMRRFEGETFVTDELSILAQVPDGLRRRAVLLGPRLDPGRAVGPRDGYRLAERQPHAVQLRGRGASLDRHIPRSSRQASARTIRAGQFPLCGGPMSVVG